MAGSKKVEITRSDGEPQMILVPDGATQAQAEAFGRAIEAAHKAWDAEVKRVQARASKAILAEEERHAKRVREIRDAKEAGQEAARLAAQEAERAAYQAIFEAVPAEPEGTDNFPAP